MAHLWDGPFPGFGSEDWSCDFEGGAVEGWEGGVGGVDAAVGFDLEEEGGVEQGGGGDGGGGGGLDGEWDGEGLEFVGEGVEGGGDEGEGGEVGGEVEED